jgi:adenylate cyclase
MPVKYKGNIDMYFVKGFRPELSINMQGREPNEQFFIKLQVLRLQDIEEEFLKRMEEDLPATLYFHNQKYCIDLLTRCELLFNSENLSEEERLLVRCAALLDCMSYSKGYSKREEYINQLGREILPKYHYSEIQSERNIQAFKQPFFPS